MNTQDLIERAIDSNADPKLINDLVERQAKQDFILAMSNFQSEVPSIKKTKEAHKYKYAPLCDISEQIKGHLKKNGLCYQFQMEKDQTINVSCVVSHTSGHSERTSMVAPADVSTNKNSVQAIGSTITYLQRYTLISALGITTADEDMDGRLPFVAINKTQQKEIEALLKKTKANVKQFLKFAGVASLGEIAAPNYQVIIDKINDVENQKK